MLTLTEPQSTFITRASPESVLIACPGSGKTHTAVLRFIERCKVERDFGVAFLSYTNVAVNEANTKAAEHGAGGLIGHPHAISTIDSFFRTFVFDAFIRTLLPNVPSEVEIIESRPVALGTDKAYSIYGIRPKARGKAFDAPLEAWEIECFLQADRSLAYDYRKSSYSQDRVTVPADYNRLIARSKARYLERGFATYNDILLFCYFLLRQKSLRVAEIVAKRFAEIIVDEAQDTSTLQQEMLQMVAAAGAKISYVGDPSQGIYLFNKANPSYLTDLETTGHERHELLTNFRSVYEIVAVVNSHFGKSMRAKRSKTHPCHGAYLFVGQERDAISSFEKMVSRAEIAFSDAAVLVRKRSDLGKALQPYDVKGWRSAPRFAIDAWQRERRGEFQEASQAALRLLKAVAHPDGLAVLETTRIKELAWLFLRGPAFPTPSGRETPQQWCGRLKTALESYLTVNGIAKHDGFGARTAPNGMRNVGSALEEFSFDRPTLRTTVIHQAKGETISGVLVVAPPAQHDKWLADVPDQEESNICYVAFTRAADLLVLQCPDETYAARWRERGFKDFITL